ncbi:MAG: alpha-amylase family glycosyl hydrolase [Nitriliruptoraceae bacterium]
MPGLRAASGSPFDGVVYQIYPRSFLDADGDGVGDLAGITAQLDHLAWLGVDAVWLSPIYRSPMKDYGYDVADHCDVDPLFGTLEDADALIAAAHERGMEVWLDFVPNHTSDRHPWFQASRASREAPERDFYLWRDPAPDGGPPNNWIRHFADGAPAWTFDEVTGQYYLHQFLPEQPDLNWRNPELRERMLDVLRFWIDRGVDGFRSDVIHMIGKDPALRDDEPPFAGHPRAGHHHEPEAAAPHLRAIRAMLDEHPGVTMVGEVNLPVEQVAAYVGPDALHLAFQFSLLGLPWEPAAWREAIRRAHGTFDAIGVPPTWVLSNHDIPRVATRVGGQDAARTAAVLLFTLRGVPFLYMGDELGQEDAVVPSDRVVDPGGRDGCRAPIPWTASAADRHGWAGEPWLPWPPAAAARSVEALRADPRSILHLHRRLIALRRSVAALRSGAMTLLDLHPDLVAYDRVADGEVLRVLANLGAADVDLGDPAADVGGSGDGTEVDAATTWSVLLTSDLDPAVEGARFSGVLHAGRAVVLAAVPDASY